MALHEVQLKGYNVRPGNLSLGTFGSYGIEQLHVTLADTAFAWIRRRMKNCAFCLRMKKRRCWI